MLRVPILPNLPPTAFLELVLGERHKVHLIAHQGEEELTVMHGRQDARCKILTVKVAVSSLHWFRTPWQGTTKHSSCSAEDGAYLGTERLPQVQVVSYDEYPQLEECDGHQVSDASSYDTGVQAQG